MYEHNYIVHDLYVVPFHTSRLACNSKEQQPIELKATWDHKITAQNMCMASRVYPAYMKTVLVKL